ncbi:MAG: hypothetical protein KAS65_03385 [Candidatus Aminicenantes bacterium]|nr:hypothetical protein [Candidatus Aminicenantes bacterium]
MGKILLILFIIFSLSFQVQSQEDEITTTETVSVVNVEVPVRVFLKGEAVDHLKKSDFKLYEGGEEQEINGFYLKRKKIRIQNQPPKLEKRGITLKPRYFVLVFRITKFNEQLQKGLDYIFSNILNEYDQLMVFINNKSVFFKSLSNMKSAREILMKAMKEESQKARFRLLKYLKKVEDELSLSRIQSLLGRGDYHLPDEIIRFLQKYLLIWDDYSRNYLTPNVDRYYYFSQHLEKIKKEKWVINFYQIEMFPKLSITGQLMEQVRDLVGAMQSSFRPEDNVKAKTISALLRDIDSALHTTKNFPGDEISKLFYKVDATFHTILIFVNHGLLHQDLQYKRISTEIESSLREITKRTGGSLEATGNLEKALNNIEDKEDIYYILTYAPRNPQKVGKVKVEVKNKNYRIIYDNQMRADYIMSYLKRKKLEIPDIYIKSMTFEKNALSFIIENYLQKEHNKKNTGHIQVKIQIQDPHNQICYDKVKIITTQKKFFSISIKFPWMKKGRYDIILQVTDMLSRKSASDFLQPTIY